MYPPVQLFLADEREFRLLLTALRHCQDTPPVSDRAKRILGEPATSEEFRNLANKLLIQPCNLPFVIEATDR